jgi:hypothetical protein
MKTVDKEFVTPAKSGLEIRSSFPIRRRRPKKRSAPEVQKPLSSKKVATASAIANAADLPPAPPSEPARRLSISGDAYGATPKPAQSAAVTADSLPETEPLVQLKSPPLSDRFLPTAQPELAPLPASLSKRRKPPSKAYATIPTNFPDAKRFRILVQDFLKGAHVAAVEAKPPMADAELDTFEMAVVDGVEAAGESERGQNLELTPRTKVSPEDAKLRSRAAQLDYIVRQYARECEQWETMEKDLSATDKENVGTLSRRPEDTAVLPPLPAVEKLIDVQEVENYPSVVDAVESFVLHTDELNHTLKRLEGQQKHTGVVASTISKILNASVFDGHPFDLNASKIDSSPRPRI